jgi:hypothetical protein
VAQNSGKFIAYYRVSTGRQGKPGLLALISANPKSAT